MTTNLCAAANCPVEVRLLPLQQFFSCECDAPVIFITGFFMRCSRLPASNLYYVASGDINFIIPRNIVYLVFAKGKKINMRNWKFRIAEFRIAEATLLFIICLVCANTHNGNNKQIRLHRSVILLTSYLVLLLLAPGLAS